MDAQFRSPETDSQSRTYGMLCHLTSLSTFVGVPGFIGPLAIWLIKKDEMPFVDDQGKESLNFQISMFLYAIISGVLVLAIIGIFLLIVVAIAAVVLPVMAAIQANEGTWYRYPLTIRLIK